MRRMKPLTGGQTSVMMTSQFYGYHHEDIIADGEMYDMENMSGDEYPSLALRKKRGILSMDPEGSEITRLSGIHGRDHLVFVRGGQVWYNAVPVSGLNNLNSTHPKKIVSMGAYVCIWPDKKYFNTVDLSDCGDMGRTWSLTGSSMSIQLCRVDGTDIDNVTQSSTAPASPSPGDYWIDTNGVNDVLMQWAGATQEWIEIGTPYVRIHGTGIGDGLKEYDVVETSGLEAASGVTDPTVREQVEALNGSMIVYHADVDNIVVAGLLRQTQNSLAANTVSCNITVPDLDFICESNNRLWGCRYGLVGTQIVNEIKASKLGDFRNWNCYMGLSTDSYTASVGTDGVFTGAITQRGYPVFFKENCIHRVSGQTPSSFSIQTTIARGVQRDSWRSLAVVSENIYYKARNAVMVYDGNMPQSISAKLGDQLYYDARAGALGDKYYISMKDAEDNWSMFCYDTRYGTWYKEDATKALGFGEAEDELFFIDEDNNTLCSVKGTTLSADGSTTAAEEDLDWSATFDLVGVGYFPTSSDDAPVRVRNAKYISMFKIRMRLAADAWMKLWIRYDEDDDWTLMGQRSGTDLKTFVLPVIPKRCDHMRFKLEGHGGVKIYDLSRIMEVGGDG